MFTCRKIVGFIVFGSLASTIYAVTFSCLTYQTRLPVFIYSIIYFLVATPISYLGNRWITYRSKNVLGPESLRFIAVQSSNLVMTSLLVHVISTIFPLSTIAKIAVAVIFAPIVSFILYEIWVYREPKILNK